MKDVGEPGAGEPHARFDGGELEKEPLRLPNMAALGKPRDLSPVIAYGRSPRQLPTRPSFVSGGVAWPAGVAEGRNGNLARALEATRHGPFRQKPAPSVRLFDGLMKGTKLPRRRSLPLSPFQQATGSPCGPQPRQERHWCW